MPNGIRVRRASGLVTTAALIAGGVVALTGATTGASASPAKHAQGCQLGNGVKHVISLVFDNVHFARDNRNVPSDLEQMPNLLNFLKSNGTVMSNLHTPMIAHTADDSLTIYTGLYGDRHGQPLSNSYKTYNPDGSTDPASSFAYWTAPVNDTLPAPTAGHDTTPSMVYSATSPAKSGDTSRQTPAPWVPFTRAGCTVGDFSTANMVLENPGPDLKSVFGPSSPEVAQFNADASSFKDAETADYVGVAVHCAKNDSVCSSAQGVKFGQTSPSPTAVTDSLPTEPGGYNGYQGLFGARYVAPQLGGGIPLLTHNGFPVTDASGFLTDIDGNPIINGFSHTAGFPGFSPTASQSLAYLADMQEQGIPVTYGYISDLHERKAGTSGCTTAAATSSGSAIGPGDACFVNNAKAYDEAFGKFFARLQSDGITPANTLFVISAEENDQFAGANVGRAIQPTPAGCDGVTTPCNYAIGQLGEISANIKGLLSTTPSAGTPFDIEPQGASIYVHGQPAANDAAVRQLERDTAEKIINYQAGALEQRILHMQTADPLRTPTYTLFPKPDYFFGTSGPNTSIFGRFAWDHGYYSPNIDITWAGLVGPGVANRGVDGPSPEQGNQVSDPNSTRTVPQASTIGTWAEEADLRPTMLHLAGLNDDYQSDGRVISQVLSRPGHALVAAQPLASIYQQLNSSVGAFATDTLIADSKALASGSSTDDSAYQREQSRLAVLANARDALASVMKVQLAAAAGGHPPQPIVQAIEIALGRILLQQAHQLSLA
jgi:hypothetical protein